MIALDPAWLLALPVAFALGWMLSGLDRRQRRRARRFDLKILDATVLDLVDGRRREVLDPLREVARNQPAAVGIQRGMATLLREQGQVDRSLEIRQMLLQREGVEPHERAELQLELAEDYLAAGILDRAELQLLQVLECPGEADLRQKETRQRALSQLVGLLMRLGRWSDALAHLPVQPSGAQERLERFHVLCELGRVDEALALLPTHPRLGILRDGQPAPAGPTLCRVCGFLSQRHAWQCPGCRQWDSSVRVALD